MSNTVKVVKEVPGIISCILEHEITKTKAHFNWIGPKISPQVWQQVLAFFKWTYEEHKSESQVRLFVSATEWKAWAFPQKARTYMSATELPDLPEYKEQRAQFGDGWQYFGTVHHHCGGSAFQSGTDRSNEESQDGLHITIGKMDEKLHDMHVRLYISGTVFEPKMNWFWDTDTFFAGIPKDMKMFLVDGVEDRLARAQMCQPAPKELEFPEQWRKNVIEIKPEKTTTTEYAGGLGYRGFGGEYFTGSGPQNYFKSGKVCSNLRADMFKARKEIIEQFKDSKDPALKKADPISTLQNLCLPWVVEIIQNLYRNDVEIDELIKYMLEMEKLEIEAAEREKKGGKKHKKGNGNVTAYDANTQGVPDYSGVD